MEVLAALIAFGLIAWAISSAGKASGAPSNPLTALPAQAPANAPLSGPTGMPTVLSTPLATGPSALTFTPASSGRSIPARVGDVVTVVLPMGGGVGYNDDATGHGGVLGIVNPGQTSDGQLAMAYPVAGAGTGTIVINPYSQATGAAAGAPFTLTVLAAPLASA